MSEEVELEPLVYRYAIQVPPPPAPDGGETLDAPDGLRLLVGLPVLVEPDADFFAAVYARPEHLWAWVLQGPGARDGLATVEGGRLVGATRGHLLLLGAWDGPEQTLGARFPEPSLCALSEVRRGLTLYRDLGTDGGCGRWRPLAEPGERTEFQGVPMVD